MCSTTRQLLVLLVIAGGAASVQSIVLPEHLTLTPKSHYQPFEAVGADYVQLGKQRASFAYNNPFSELGCSNPDQGFTGVTALTGYGFPVLKLLVEFDDGHSATFGNCTDFCYATHINLLPGELITRLSLYDFNYSQNSTVWSAFGGLRITTAGSAGKRVLNLGYSGVTPWAVGTPYDVDVGSGFLCGVYGYSMDAQFPYADLQGTGVGLVKGSIVALGLAFLKPVTSSELGSMRFPSLQQLTVPGTAVKTERFTLSNAGPTQAAFSPHSASQYTYTQTWESPSRLQMAYATLALRAAGNATTSVPIDVNVAQISQVPGGGTRATGSWQAWPIPVILGQYNLGQYQISDLGTISATQTYTFNADFSLIAPAQSSVSYDIALSAGQFAIPYSASLVLTLGAAGGTLNVTINGTFDGIVILGASATIRAPTQLGSPGVATGGGGAPPAAAGGSYNSRRQVMPSPVPQYADASCPAYLGDQSVTVVAQLPVATVSVVGTSFLLQSKCVRLLYPCSEGPGNTQLVR